MKIRDSCVARRRFVSAMIGGGAAALGAGSALPLVQYAGNFRPDPPPDFVEFELSQCDVAPGKARMLMYGRIPLLLVRDSDTGGELKAFVATCTHLSCTVHYDEVKKCIVCACHGGYFGLDGHVISGPPPAPLRQFHHKIRDGKLVVALEPSNLEKAL